MANNLIYFIIQHHEDVLECEGAKQNNCKNQLRLLMKSHDPDILILVETKINSDRDLSVICSLKIPNFKNIPSEVFSGGIWLIWKDYVDSHINIISTSSTFIHCQVHDN